MEEGLDKGIDKKKLELKPGRLKRFFEKTGLTPKVLLVLAVISCIYVWLYFFVGPGCLGSLIFVATFIISFVFIFFIAWSAMQAAKKKKAQSNETNRGQDEARGYQAAEEQPLTSQREQ